MPVSARFPGARREPAEVALHPRFLRGAPRIFIIGLPRSGSTLIEQILASHSLVEGTMELADIPRLVQDLQGRETHGSVPRYPAVLAQLSAEDFKRLGD